ncbi:MAG: zinc-dependent alcohol dehydrogenase family protein [Planctomycetota bacterium]
MTAMVFEAPGKPLGLRQMPLPRPGPRDLLIRVEACGVCRTDLHLLEGDIRPARFPIIPGHEIVGAVAGRGRLVRGFRTGDRVGVPWLGGACGTCAWCRGRRENLCDKPVFTGLDRNGGFAEFAAADHRFCFPIPPGMDAVHAAPLLCAGLIGYRALRLAGNARRVGFHGFGAAAHILLPIARWEGRQVYAFTRPGDRAKQAFARRLGAAWAGNAGSRPPRPLDAVIIFAPDGSAVPEALRAVAKGGVVVCAGIHMTDIPSLPYRILWEERVLRSVANLTRADGRDFFRILRNIPVRPEATSFPLAAANEALRRLKEGKIRGAAVLTME